MALVIKLDLSQVAFLQSAEVEVIRVSVNDLDPSKDVVTAILVPEVDLDHPIDIVGLDLVALDQVFVDVEAEVYLKIAIEGQLQDLTGDDEVGQDQTIGVTDPDPIIGEAGLILIVGVVDLDRITGGVGLGRIIAEVDLDQNVDVADQDQIIEHIIPRVHIVEVVHTKEIVEMKPIKGSNHRM